MPSPSRTIAAICAGFLCVSSALLAERPVADGQTGTAAFYSHAFEGRHTSDHGTFRSNRLTAASATLPLGSKVRVTNVQNNRSVVLRVTDRYADKNRIIDVSKSAAQKLRFARAGTAQVRVQPL